MRHGCSAQEVRKRVKAGARQDMPDIVVITRYHIKGGGPSRLLATSDGDSRLANTVSAGEAYE